MTTAQMILAFLFPVLLIIGVPIYATLGLVGFAAAFLTDSPLEFASQSILNGVNKFPLLAIPAFVLAGNLMEQGGITRDIIRIFTHLFGHIRGSMGIITIFSCMFFAAMSGSGPGTVAAIGAIMIPAMVKHGYPASYSAATAATGGTLGVLIPPSNPMILYGIIANVSITDMFIAGIFPGIILGIVLAVIAYLMARINGVKAISRDQRGDNETGLLRLLWQGKAALFLPILILGGIYSGMFTPVEASVVAVVYAFLVGKFVYKSMDLKHLKPAFERTHIVSGALMVIVACSTLFARIVTLERVPQTLISLFSEATSNPIVLLLMINAFLLVIGTFMETLSAIIILGPILVPLVVSFGIDPVHFGIILIINIEIAFLTPPLGVNLFVAAQLAKIPMEKMIVSMMPFVLGLIAMLGFVMLLPEISLYLPRLLK